MRSSIKHWPFWLLVSVVVLFCCGLAGNFLSFPLGLGLLRVMFLITEQVWPQVRA